VNCFGGDDGFISIIGEGGSGVGYNYTWNNSQWTEDSTSNSITNLVAGTYYLTISDKDPRGGEIYDSIIISQPTSLYAITFNIITKPSCIDSTGVISVKPGFQGGTLPYNFEWYLW